jgi:exodeoxyribonuclease VII small subunit
MLLIMAKKQKTYKEAIDEINQIIEKIENEELDVDQLSENVKEVQNLLKICKDKLTVTEKEIESIIENIKT